MEAGQGSVGAVMRLEAGVRMQTFLAAARELTCGRTCREGTAGWCLA